VIDIRHTRALGLFGHNILGLPFGPDEKYLPALSHNITDHLADLLQDLQGGLKIDNVNASPLPIDKPFHFGIPALGLMAEMDPGL
jgi:hypothetical protein